MFSLHRFLQHRTLLVAILLFLALPARSQSPSGTFTISAGNVTITRAGGGAVPFTLTSVNGFTGSIVIGCAAPAVPSDVRIPGCGGGPAVAIPLAADEVFTSTIPLSVYGAPQPVGFLFTGQPAITALLVIALLSGLTLRRRSARKLTLPLVVVALAVLGAATGCGTNPGYTPGTYHYTVTAAPEGSHNPLGQGASATVTIR